MQVRAAGLLLDRLLDEVDSLLVVVVVPVKRGEQRDGVLILRRDPMSVLGICKGAGTVLHLHASSTAHGEQIRIFGMLRETRFDELRGTRSSAAEQIQPGQAGARLHMLGILIERALVETGSAAQIAEFLGNPAVHEAGFGIVRRDLQRVPEFDAGLFEVAFGVILLAAFHVSRHATLGTATGGQHEQSRHRGSHRDRKARRTKHQPASLNRLRYRGGG